MKKFCSRLRELRGDDSQTKISKIFGVSQQTYANWETGRNEPDITTLSSIACHYKVPVGWLLGVENTVMPDPPPKIVASPAALSFPDPNNPMATADEVAPELEKIKLSRVIPVLGMAAALEYNPLFCTLDELKERAEQWVYYVGHEKDVFAIHITGNSMLPVLRHDDIVAVQPIPPETGNLCIALHRPDGIVCKRWYRQNGFVRLEASNKKSKSYKWSFADFEKDRPIEWWFKVIALIQRTNLLADFGKDDDE